MSTFMSDEEFESYVASQQADSTDVERPAAPASKATRSLLIKAGAMLGLVVPALLLICVGAMSWTSAPDGGKKSGVAPRDPVAVRALGWLAGIGGKDSDPKRNPFSKQHQFQGPDFEDMRYQQEKMMEDVRRQREEVMRSYNERMSRQFQGY